MNAAVTWITVPCYNEQHRLDVEAFVVFAATHPNVQFCFVNDGSTDATEAVLQGLVARLPGAVAISLAPNGGKPQAVRAGLLRGIEAGAAVVGYWDADLATPLDAIEPLRAAMQDGRFDVALGARVRLLGRHIERHLLRHLLGRVFATASSLLLQLQVYDTQCGAKLFAVTPALRAALAEPFTVNWPFDVELLLRLTAELKRQGGPALCDRAVEFPLPQWRDVKGSKLSPRGMLRSGLELFRLWRGYGRGGRRAAALRHQQQ